MSILDDFLDNVTGGLLGKKKEPEQSSFDHPAVPTRDVEPGQTYSPVQEKPLWQSIDPVNAVEGLIPQPVKDTYGSLYNSLDQGTKPTPYVPSTTTYTGRDAALGAAANVYDSAARHTAEGEKGVIQSLLHPADTVSSIGGLLGTVLVGSASDKMDLANTISQATGDWAGKYFGSWDKVKRTMAEDPMLPLATLASVTPVGRAGEVKSAEELAAAAKAAKEARAAVRGVTKSTDLPNLRGMPPEQAIPIARTQAHLIESGEGSDGKWVGAPRNIQTPADLRRQRAKVDRGIDAGDLGGDWYDRYRRDVGQVTGDDALNNRWMTSLHGQMSAGVSPESELQGALKETNASIAGPGTKAMRPAQHEAHMEAIAQQDPTLYQLGEKTGEYAKRIEPIQEGGLLTEPQSPMIGHNQGPPLDPLPPRVPGTTGVNDFRWAAEHGFTEPDGTPQKNALTSAQHKWLDYETTLAVDRANKRAAGGRTNWTGEQVQAAGWVRQKADAILAKRANEVQADVDKATAQAKKQGASKAEITAAADQVRADHDTRAFGEANRQIGDYYDKHQAFATHESRPGSDTGHVPGLLNATPEQVAAYHADPASTWATAPGGRDAIYSGTGIPGTGVNMRVRPSTDMQGMYTPPGGPTEFNPGAVARPLVAFDNSETGLKSVPHADRSLLQAGETVRAGVDAQNAGAAHKVWVGGPAGESNSMWTPMSRKLTPDEMLKLEAHGKANGLPHVVDTGRGVTLTDFDKDPAKMSKKQFYNHVDAIKDILPDAGQSARSKVDSVYAGLSDAWKKGLGSGAVTNEMLKAIGVTPEMWRAFNHNPYLAERALAKMKRDASQPGARLDLQNLRKIIASGPGWADRLKAAHARGEYLPAIGAVGTGGLLSEGALHQDEDQQAR